MPTDPCAFSVPRTAARPGRVEQSCIPYLYRYCKRAAAPLWITADERGFLFRHPRGVGGRSDASTLLLPAQTLKHKVMLLLGDGSLYAVCHPTDWVAHSSRLPSDQPGRTKRTSDYWTGLGRLVFQCRSSSPVYSGPTPCKGTLAYLPAHAARVSGTPGLAGLG